MKKNILEVLEDSYLALGESVIIRLDPVREEQVQDFIRRLTELYRLSREHPSPAKY